MCLKILFWLSNTAVLFDWDGTLFDTEDGLNLPAKMEVCFQALSRKGFNEFPDKGVFYLYRGKTILTTMEMLIKEYGLTDSISFTDKELEQLVSEEDEAVISRMSELPNLYTPGVPKILEDLHDLGIPMAICSNSPRVRIIRGLEVTGLKDLFPDDRIFTAYDTKPAQPKPRPDVYKRAFRALGWSRKALFAAEDSISGLVAAKSAAIPCFGFAGSIHPEHRAAHIAQLSALGAVAVLEDFSDLPRQVYRQLILNPGYLALLANYRAFFN